MIGEEGDNIQSSHAKTGAVILFEALLKPSGN